VGRRGRRGRCPGRKEKKGRTAQAIELVNLAGSRMGERKGNRKKKKEGRKNFLRDHVAALALACAQSGSEKEEKTRKGEKKKKKEGK